MNKSARDTVTGNIRTAYLMYVSTARSDLAEHELTEIAEVSGRNNGHHELSGLLVFNGTNFMGLLEGPSAASSARFNRISRDKRHSGLSILNEGTAKVRSFAEWQMMILPLDDKGSKEDNILADILSKTDMDGKNRSLFENFRSLGNLS